MAGDLTVEPAAINLWVLVLALGAEAAIGYPDALYRLIRHPVVWFGAIIAALDRPLNQPAWRNWQRRLAGLAALLLLLAIVGSLTIALSMFLRSLPYGWLVEALLAASLLAQRPEIADSIITHRFPLDGAREAFDLVRSDAPSLKVVLEP